MHRKGHKNFEEREEEDMDYQSADSQESKVSALVSSRKINAKLCKG